MTQSRVALAWIGAALFAVAAIVCVPIGIEAENLLATEDDPAAIADRALARSFDQSVALREIESALAANDADLAKSYLDLATDRNIAVPPPLAARVTAAVERANSTSAQVESFARGFITGEPDDVVGLAGTALGDLFVFGDIRDAVREGSRYVNGEKTDELVLGLACVGIAITAGTYATFGAAAPARVGLSMVKAARKTGQIGTRMAEWIGRSLREVVDLGALRRAGSALAEPAVAVRTAREVVKVDKAAGGGSRPAGQRRRPGAVARRHQGRARWPEACERAARDGAHRQACREEGQQDPRDPQDAGPRRDPAFDRHGQSRVLDHGRDFHAVRFRLFRQGRGRARHATLSPAPERAPEGTIRGADGDAGLIGAVR